MNTTATTTATVKNSVNNNKIQDFGQKIGGARKDLVAAALDLAAIFAGVTVDSLKALQLSKVAKFAQIEKLATSGAISEECARACFALWRTIDSKPATAWKVSTWAQKTAAVIAKISDILAGGEISEEVRALPDFRVLTAANYPSEPFSFGHYSVAFYSSSSYISSWGRPSAGLAVIAGHSYKIKATSGTPEQNAKACADYIREHMEAEKKERAAGATFELWRDGSTYYAAPKGKNKIRVKTWSNREEAREGMKDTDALREAWEKIRNTPALRRTTNRARVGEDYRQGVDITPETFAHAFAFRGVEFGNWLTQADRLTRLNETFDSLRDLCALCALTADAATLRGWLAMAFGSRGIPGAAAHFEHSHRVINLTKEHGAGSLAHEWFHALDAFTASRLGGGIGMMAVNNYAQLPEGEEREAARALYMAVYKSHFARRSEHLDYLKGKTYYGTIVELCARAFECYVIELAGVRGMVCDFLANVTTPQEWRAFYGDLSAYPYPTADEVAELAPHFARFLAVCCDAEELSKEAAQLFEEGRARMEAQRAEQAEKVAQAMEEQSQERAKVHEAERLQMAEKVAAVVAECGAAWSFLFDSGKWYGCIGGAGFFGIVYPSGSVAWRTTRKNSRLKKSVRGCYGYILEVRPGVNLEEFARKDLAAGFTGLSLIAKAWANTYAETWEEFSKRNAEALQKAKEAQEAQKRTQERANVAEPTNTKAEAEKAAERRENAKKGNRPEVDTTAAPADGLQLVEISRGVAVVGDTRTTYRNRREIKAHGATWNKTAQRWEATEAEKVAQLRAWFALDEQTTEATAEASTDAGEPAEGKGVEFNAEGLEALRQKFAEMEAKETAEGAPDQAPEADTMGAPAEGQEVAESEAVASGAPRYSVCEKSPISEKSGAGSPFFPCWGVFEFGDVDCNSHEPRLANAFDTEAKAREWLQQCADGTGALCADAVDVLAYAGGFWMVWYSDRSGGYYCQYVAQRADARDLSGALLQCESLNLRQRLHDLKREHMARQMAEKVAKLQAGEVYAVDYDGEGVTAENDSANAGRYVVTFWSYGEMKERHTNRTAAEAAQAVADFVAVNVPARVWNSPRCLLHTFKADEIPYYSGSEKSPILQNVETPTPSDYSPLTGEELARAFEKARKLSRSALRTMWPRLELSSYMMAYAAATDRPFPIMAEAVTAVTTGAQSWTAPDGCTLKLEREQFKEYGESLHLLYYSATGELQEHSVKEFYTDAVKAVCVFVFKHTKSTTAEAVRNEPADLPDGYGVDADRYPVGSDMTWANKSEKIDSLIKLVK